MKNQINVYAVFYVFCACCFPDYTFFIVLAEV